MFEQNKFEIFVEAFGVKLIIRKMIFRVLPPVVKLDKVFINFFRLFYQKDTLKVTTLIY